MGIIGSEREIEERIKQWQQTDFGKLQFFCLLPLPNLEMGIDYKLIENLSELLLSVDAIDLLDAANDMISVCEQAATAHKDIFLANPFLLSISELNKLTRIVRESGIRCQPGLYLRFQEDIWEAHRYEFRFLESILSFTAESSINDSQWKALVNNHVDLLSFLAKSSIKRIAAFALDLKGTPHGLLNFRIQFENLAVANCTINTKALISEQLSILFSRERQYHILWAKNENSDYAIFDENCVINAMGHFIESIYFQVATKVTIFDALNTCELSQEIINQIEF